MVVSCLRKKVMVLLGPRLGLTHRRTTVAEWLPVSSLLLTRLTRVTLNVFRLRLSQLLTQTLQGIVTPVTVDVLLIPVAGTLTCILA